jgi:hypothetical protein
MYFYNTQPLHVFVLSICLGSAHKNCIKTAGNKLLIINKKFGFISAAQIVVKILDMLILNLSTTKRLPQCRNM